MNQHNASSMHQGHNDSIGCSVTECKYHDSGAEYCTLEKIQVVKHEPVANSVQCTDCGSFIKQ
jgi:hypothetical protein